ncbi:HD domain-containing protein [Lysinibacillus fusiformis]|uniref:HD domain-containing protein n=1 Tax=Lysinibacillus fusiformis TaxID=28031 RepID=UPI0018809C46|nr:HD domain-containing protein [Lysinibacillus fusiformis]MBD8520968.1 HD domain-containing protein [Lysinibacillus fusiformis]
MLIKDALYGEFEIDGVLEELIQSAPVQRLKGIHQAGAGYLVNRQWDITRYEHSLGVMLLIRRYGGSLEEQIAGLLHDVSHTAFSHVVDVVLENTEEDYHDTVLLDVIQPSAIPEILSKYGYDMEEILFDITRWSLLEQPAPELCADRVDYTLRDMFHYGEASFEEIQRFLEDVFVYQGKLCVKTIDSAEWFVKTYYQEVIDFFMEPINIYATNKLAHVLRLAVAKGILSMVDFQKDDEAVWEQIKASNDEEIQRLLQQLHEKVEVIEDVENFDFHSRQKVRLIDPSVYHHRQLYKASDLSDYVKEINTRAIKKFEKGVYMRIIKS